MQASSMVVFLPYFDTVCVHQLYCNCQVYTLLEHVAWSKFVDTIYLCALSHFLHTYFMWYDWLWQCCQKRRKPHSKRMMRLTKRQRRRPVVSPSMRPLWATRQTRDITDTLTVQDTLITSRYFVLLNLFSPTVMRWVQR